MKTIRLALLLLATVSASRAAQLTFTGLIDSNWFNRTNWSSLSLPTAQDDVVISLGRSVHVSTAAEFRTLTFVGGSLAGQLEVNAGATVTFDDASAKYIGASITNNGTIRLRGESPLLLTDGIQIVNGPTGVLSIESDVDISHFTGASPSIVNHGLITRVGATNRSAFNGVFLTNYARFRVESGILDLPTGMTSDGEVTVSENASLRLSGGKVVLLPSATFSGAGFYGVVGSVEVDGAIRSDNFRFEGSVNGRLSIIGRTLWTGGSLSAETTVTKNSTLELQGPGAKFLSGGLLQNEGTVLVQSEGDLLMSSSARFENRPQGAASGTLIVRNNRSIHHFSGEKPVLVNNGLIQVEASATSMINGLLFTNNAEVVVRTGKLDMPSGFTSRGEFNVARGASLTLSGGAVVLLPGSSFTGDGFFGVTGQVEVSGAITSDNFQVEGTLAGTNSISARVPWTQGSIVGSTTVEAGGHLALSGPSAKYLAYNVLTNLGKVSLAGESGLLFSGGSIESEGSIEMEAGISIRHFSGEPSTLRNKGTIIISGEGTSSIEPSVFIQSGTVEVRSGQLSLGARTEADGEFKIAGEASLVFPGGTLVLSPRALFSGAGFYGVTGHATVIGDIRGENFQLQGTLVGTNGIVGRAVWSNGSLAGQTTVRAGGTLQINGPSAKYLYQADLRNQGTVQWTGGQVLLTAAPAISNEASGRFLIETGEDLPHFSGEVGSFVNLGLILKTGGDDTQIGASFTNRGSVEISVGSLSFPRDYIQASGRTHVQGTLASPNVRVESGTLSGGGTVSGNVSNGGVVATSPSDGRLSIVGGLTQRSDGAIVVNVSSNDRSSYGVEVFGSAHLDGALSVNFVEGYQPLPGTQLQLLSYRTRTGSFARVDGLHAINGRNWRVFTGLTEVTASLEALFNLTMEAGGAFKIDYQGQAGGRYEVLASEDLQTWATLTSTNTVSGLVTFRDEEAANHPRRFYHIRLR